MKIEIKNWLNGEVIFSHDAENNTVRLTLEMGVKAGADLSRANLSRAYLSGANLSRADLSRAYLSGADLSRANLSGADLSGADLSRANLSRAYLSGANLSRADLSRAYLSGANLSRADLSGADLSRANLSRAYLSGADLSGADLSRANLSRAYLSGANLSRANLSGADLSRATGINKYLADDLRILFDQKGKIRAYKLVDSEYNSPIHDKKLQYKKGQIVSVPLTECNKREEEHCGAGVNLATLPWCMKEWKEGYKILICEFTAKDIVAIPIGTDGKFRVQKCKVVGEKDLVEIGLVKEAK
jgi:uncharacterized protein YjbI with pentapeptide repeats